MAEFATFPLAPHLLEKLAERGFTTPTPIQNEALGPLLEGKDAILHSPTGTGKTLAFLLPLLTRIDPTQAHLQAVVVAPSRELAMQILGEIQSLSAATSLVAHQLIGGANIHNQIERLKKHPQIVVGTPGRLAELGKMGKLKLARVTTLVVDEIDQSLNTSFRDDLIKLLKALGRDRQTIWASATLGADVEELARRWLQEPVRIAVAEALTLPDTLTHGHVVCDARDKLETLRKLVHATNPPAALVFVNDAFRGAEIASKLSFKGVNAGAMTGEASKIDRAGMIKDLRAGKLQVLVSTELAARGLDLPGLTHVFNFELPTDAPHYLHRAGRTGRLNQQGTVVSLVTPEERFVVTKLEKALGISIPAFEVHHGQVQPIPQAVPAPPAAPPEAGPGPREDGVPAVAGESPAAEGAALRKPRPPKPTKTGKALKAEKVSKERKARAARASKPAKPKRPAKPAAE